MRILLIICVFALFSPTLYAHDYHVMNMRKDGRAAQVVFHVEILDENNAVGISLQTALKEYIDGANFVSKYPGIAGTELIDIQNGSLYEQVETVVFLAADTNGQKQAKIDNKFISLSASVLNKTREILKFWGLDRDVP